MPHVVSDVASCSLLRQMQEREPGFFDALRRAATVIQTLWRSVKVAPCRVARSTVKLHRSPALSRRPARENAFR